MPRQQERYCAKLVSDALGGIEYKSGHRFPFLRGDPTPKRPNGVTLPVDAYYPDFRLVLEFREAQHYSDRVALWDNRITATGQMRKEQGRSPLRNFLPSPLIKGRGIKGEGFETIPDKGVGF